MERVTFRRPDVRKVLSGMVCMKVDAGKKGGHPLARKYRAKGYPTIVVIEPDGRVLYNVSGAPTPERFADYFVEPKFHAAFKAYKAKQWSTVARHAFFLKKWFAKSTLVTGARWLGFAAQQKEYKEAYARTKKVYDARLARARKTPKGKESAKKTERRLTEKDRIAAMLLEEADRLQKKGARGDAVRIYKRIALEYPSSPAAERARKVLAEQREDTESST